MIVFTLTLVLLLEDRFFMFDATTGRIVGNSRNIKLALKKKVFCIGHTASIEESAQTGPSRGGR